MEQNGTRATGPRCIALVGPFQSGKTTLLEAILARTGAIQRQGTAEAGTTVGDASKEARHHRMSVELSVATTSFMGDSTIHDVLKLLQPASRSKLLLRQIPAFSGDLISGFVDLALERAFVYKEHAPSEVVPLEGDVLDAEKTARFSMLETLADHDDELMEQLLGDIQPPKDKVFDDLAKELREGLVCPVLMGSAARTNGVLRLMKALRHEAPDATATAQRLGLKAGNDPIAYVLKTWHTAHGGKMSIARVLNGQVGDGTTFQNPEREAGRVAGVFKIVGQNTEKRGPAQAGETVALGKLDHANTGDTLTAGKQAHPELPKAVPYAPVLAMAVAAKERKDDVKLGQALSKLLEEDRSVTVVHNPEAHEVVLWGQGEMQLRVATERLTDRFGVPTVSHKPTVGYRETIKRGIVQ